MSTNAAESMSQKSSNSSAGPNFNDMIAVAKSITLDPVGTWPKIKARTESIPDIYKNYLIYLAAIPAVCGLIGELVVGINIPFYGTYRPPFFSAVTTAVVMYAFALAVVYVAAMIIELLAPKFGGNASRTDGFKLMAYSATPAYLAGVFKLIPMLMILTLIAGLYGLSVYHKGITAMGAAPEDKRTSFFFVSMGCFMLAGIVLMTIFAAVTPAPPVPDVMKTIEHLGQAMH